MEWKDRKARGGAVHNTNKATKTRRHTSHTGANQTPSATGQPNLSEIIVRPARKNDAAALGRFLIRAWKEAGPGALGFTGATEDAVNAIASMGFLTQRLSSPTVKITIAERDKEVLGFASITASGKREGELSGVVVLENTSGIGLGSRLVSKACDAAGKMGIDQLHVKTEAFNKRAIGFYKKNRFTESGRVTEKVGRTKVPSMVLERKLRRQS